MRALHASPAVQRDPQRSNASERTLLRPARSLAREPPKLEERDEHHRILKRQHEEAEGLARRIIAEDDKKEARSLLGQVSKALRVHLLIEEKMVYPAAAEPSRATRTTKRPCSKHTKSTRSQPCLEALEVTPPSDKRFVVRAKVLKGIFEKHVEEEENELFPELESKLGQSGIDKLSEQVERKIVAARGRSSAPRGETSCGARDPVRATGVPDAPGGLRSAGRPQAGAPHARARSRCLETPARCARQKRRRGPRNPRIAGQLALS